MAEEEQDKSELPTPFKLERARQRGVVARGTDLGFLTGLATFLGFCWVEGRQLGQAVSHVAHNALIGGPMLADEHFALVSATGLLLAPIVRPMAILFASVLLVVLVFELVQTGFVFSGQPLKLDFSRLNPANGFKRVFSVRLLIETFKNVLKAVVYTTISFLVIRAVLQNEIVSAVDAKGLADQLQRSGVRLLAAFVLAAALFVVIDQIIARQQFQKKMRMNRRELRQEARDREGEPRLKQKRKQLHREFAKLSKSLRNLKSADVLITNPQHIALALRYDQTSMTAPTIVSIGVNQFAQRLKRMAFLYGIPIVENRTLARELYAKSALDRVIPERCYQAVADVYNGLRRKTPEIATTADQDDVA